MLSTLLATPLLAALVLFALPSRFEKLIKGFAIFVQLFLLGATIKAMVVLNPYASGLHFIEQKAWIPSFGIQYILGADALSLMLVLLTHFVMFGAMLLSWKLTHKVKEYFQLLLLLSSALGGVFLAQDAFLFFVFFEFTLLPMFFLIGVWGGKEREYASLKFFVYTFLGSLFILAAFLLMWTEARTWSLPALAQIDWTLSQKAQWIPWLLLIGFAVKIPLVPLHTWLPWAHVQASAPVSMLLAAVLLKMGVYGIFRFIVALFPSFVAEHALLFMALGILNIFWGSFCALAQNDLKKLIAYSSVAHMGFCLLGIGAFNSSGMMGAALQMFNHGICSALLFALAGVLYDRSGHHEIVRVNGELGFGDLRTRAPRTAFFLQLAAFAALGLPTLNSFVGEALVLGGVIQINTMATALTLLGMLLGAAYFVLMLKNVVWSSEKAKVQNFADLNLRETLLFFTFGVFIVVVGVYPMPVLNWLETAVGGLLGSR